MPEYKKDLPAFFDPQSFEWAKKMEENSSEILAELKNLIHQKEQSFQSYFASNRDTGSRGWKTITLKTWGIEVKDNLKQCPTLKSIISQTKGFTSAAISLLEPNTAIKSHQGDTDAIYRAHFGIEIPGELPDCGFKCKEEMISWHEGKMMVFLDAHWHEAWNNSDHRRLVLIVDVVREDYVKHTNAICIRVRAFLLLQVISVRFPSFLKWPKVTHRFLFWMLVAMLWMLFPYQKRKGVLLKHA